MTIERMAAARIMVIKYNILIITYNYYSIIHREPRTILIIFHK
jgi:hypothetical protein